MKYISLAAVAILLSIFLTTSYAKGPGEAEYTNSSDIFLILNRAISDVKTGNAYMTGHKASFEALKLAGFRVSKIVAIDLGTNIYLQIYFSDRDGSPPPSNVQGTFGIEYKPDIWKDMVKQLQITH